MKLLKKDFGDVPLKNAMIAWNPKPNGDGRIQIVPWPDKDDWCIKLDLAYTAGAAFSYWHEHSEYQTFQTLLFEFISLINNYHLQPDDVHKAFMVIPEYRGAYTRYENRG